VIKTQLRRLFIRVHNETLSIVAVRIGNERRSPATIHGCNTAPTPSGFAEIVSDDFPILFQNGAACQKFIVSRSMTECSWF
jgi:hypothetical protein